MYEEGTWVSQKMLKNRKWRFSLNHNCTILNLFELLVFSFLIQKNYSCENFKMEIKLEFFVEFDFFRCVRSAQKGRCSVGPLWCIFSLRDCFLKTIAHTPMASPVQDFTPSIGTHSDMFEGRASQMLDKRKNQELGMARHGVKVDVTVPYRSSAYFKTGVSFSNSLYFDQFF